MTLSAGHLSLARILLALAGFALSVHVMTAGPRWMTMPPLLLHASAAAFWVGSVVPLHRALTGSPQAGRLLQRFSDWAIWAVVGLVAAGLTLAWLEVRHPTALVTSLWARPRLLALLSDAPRDPGDMHVHKEHGHLHAQRVLNFAGKGFEATAVLRPGQIGAGTATVFLVDLEARPLDVSEVSLRFSNPSRGIAPLGRPAQPQGPGTWKIADAVMSVPGEWTIEVDVLVSDFERQTAGVAVDVP